jgi:predicted MFS family arabinose efflux permease
MRLYVLSLGAFAIASEGFMLAGILPVMAVDLRVGIPTAGHLVSVFAFAYAISSPLLTALTCNIERRRVLIAALFGSAVEFRRCARSRLP